MPLRCDWPVHSTCASRGAAITEMRRSSAEEGMSSSYMHRNTQTHCTPNRPPTQTRDFSHPPESTGIHKHTSLTDGMIPEEDRRTKKPHSIRICCPARISLEYTNTYMRHDTSGGPSALPEHNSDPRFHAGRTLQIVS